MNYYKVLIILLLSISYLKAQNVEWPTLANSPWPMIKYDPQFTGYSLYKGPQSATVVWTRDLPDAIFSGPVIGEADHLYFGSYFQLDSADHFYAYKPDGTFLWDYKTGTNRPPQSGILIDSSNTIYFGSLDKYFYALNPNGTLKWRYETSAPIVELAMPNIDLQGKLYITNGLGELYSINPDGTLNWQVKYEGGFFERSPVFSPDGNTIYICGADSNLFALNLDGNIEWKFSCAKIRKAPIIDKKGNIYFIPWSAPQKLYALKPDKSVKWEVKLIDSSYISVYSMPTIDSSGNIYLALGSSVFSYDSSGVFRWYYIIGTNPDEYDDFWQPLICDSEGTVYVGSTFGYYYYAISSEGNLKWKLPLNNYQVDNTGAIAKDGTLYLGVHRSSLMPDQKKTLLAIRDTTVSSVSGGTAIPSSFELYQNYPNPFNPQTKISYYLPEQSRISLQVYDINGRVITTIFKGIKSAGSQTGIFDGSNLSSGIYIYELSATGLKSGSNFRDVKRMVLIK